MKKVTFKDKTEELEKAFIKELKDPKFKALCNSLKTDSKVLMYYTTDLLNVLNDRINSEKNHTIEDCPMTMKGYILEIKVEGNHLTFFYKDCPCRKLHENMKKVKMFNMGSSLKEASFDEMFLDDKKREPIIRFLADFKKNYQNKTKGMYLYGNFGSGKSYLVAALFNELGKEGVSSVMVHMPELIRGLKESFDTDYEERIEVLQNAPLLLLDDIGAERMTEWARDEVLEPLLNYRMNEKLPTFFTSNSTLKDLEKHLSACDNNKVKAQRIIERIKFMTHPFELISENRR